MSVCAQSCLTLCKSMDSSPPGSSVRKISQARVLEWVAISYYNRVCLVTFCGLLFILLQLDSCFQMLSLRTVQCCQSHMATGCPASQKHGNQRAPGQHPAPLLPALHSQTRAAAARRWTWASVKCPFLHWHHATHPVGPSSFHTLSKSQFPCHVNNVRLALHACRWYPFHLPLSARHRHGFIPQNQDRPGHTHTTHLFMQGTVLKS